MPNLGERLEEARKRQGVSLREAAEATKIRADFLLEMESNRFDFDLPEVYKRGFLKLYGRYLKLDPEKLVTDYHALLLGAGKLGKRDKGEFFGRMDLPEAAPAAPPHGIDRTEESPRFGTSRPVPEPEPQPQVPAPRPQPVDGVDQEMDTSLYWKIALVFIGVFLLIGLFVLLIQSLMRGDTESAVATGVDPAAEVAAPAPAVTAADTQRSSVRLIAKGDLLRVMVRAEPDGEELLRQPMSEGDVIDIERDGVIRVFSTDIDRLEVEIDGRRYSSPSAGVGQMWFDRDGPVNRPR